MAREHYETLQQVFDDAYRGLAAQGFERSMSFDGPWQGCAYRGSDGRKCAIGHCIPDDRYASIMEGSAPFAVLEHAGVIGAQADIYDLSSLQHAHDAGGTPEQMRGQLVRFAERHGLTVPNA